MLNVHKTSNILTDGFCHNDDTDFFRCINSNFYFIDHYFFPILVDVDFYLCFIFFFSYLVDFPGVLLFSSFAV